MIATDSERILLRDGSGASAEVLARGAHLVSWVPAGGGEALFVSRAARSAPGVAVRGGVPVIFPQFAATGPLPRHGFARTAEWEVVEGEEGEARARLRLRDSAATRAVWPHPFAAELTVEIGGRALRLGLEVRNTGTAPFRFTAALHTYLRVADVRQAAVTGLGGTPYRDSRAAPGEPPCRDGEGELTVRGEVDRLYLGAPAELRVRDGAGGRTFTVRAEGFRDAVVWNPGAEGAASLPDMEAGEYLEMLCVEAAQVGEPVELEPGGRWAGRQAFAV